MMRRALKGGILLAALLATACTMLKPPILTVERLGREKFGVTGATLRVQFAVRNPNDRPIFVDRVEYQLEVNGHDLGRGFITEPTPLEPFGLGHVASLIDVNYLRLPGAIKSVLERDRVQARVHGHFYMREGNNQSLRKKGFSSDATVDFRK